MSKLTIMQVIRGVLAAAVGIQSNKNREKDFKYGSLSIYIVAGLIFTVLFVLLISFLVSMATGN